MVEIEVDAAGTPGVAPRQTVLIIDDDREYAGVIAECLELAGLTALKAYSGEDGLATARQTRPDLILLDVQMPGFNGYETCRRLKADGATGEITVLFMSGQIDIEDKLQGFKAGGLDYIAKPFQCRELLARVKTHLRLQDQARLLLEQTLELGRAHDELERRVEERTVALRKSQADLTFKIHELSALNAIAYVIANTSDLGDILHQVLEMTLSLAFLEAQKKGAIFLRDEKDSAWLNRVAHVGIAQCPADSGERIEVGQCLCGICAGTGKNIISTENDGAEHAVQHPGMHNHGHAVIPIKSRENVLGVMTLYLEPGFTPSELEVRLLEAIAGQIGLAVENRRLFKVVATGKKEWEETFDAIADLVTINALDHTVLRLNSAAARVFGGFQRCIGRKFYELLGDEQFAACCRATPEIGAIPGRATIWGRQYDTSVYPIEEQGVLRGCVFVAKDVTERDLAEESLREQRALTAKMTAEQIRIAEFERDVGAILNSGGSVINVLKSCTDALVKHLDAAFARIWTIDGTKTMLELQASSGIYTHRDGPHGLIATDENLKIPTIARTRKPHLTNAVVGDPQVDQEWAIREGLVSFAGYPLIVEDRVLGVLGMFAKRPLSEQVLGALEFVAGNIALGIERVHSVEALARYSEGLEETVLERTRKIEDANRELRHLNHELDLRRQEAEAANRTKSDFLANMSHELRTPLNAIIGFSDLMLRGMAGPLAGEHKEYLGDILTSGRHLLSLINDILDLSKVEAGKMEFEPAEFDLTELVGGSLSLFREKALKHRIRLDAHAGGAVRMYGDLRLIKQIVFNLVSNALKFTPDGGSVSVRTQEVRGNGGDYAEISVTDTGIGMTPEEQRQLFQPFMQLGHHLTKRHEGTGLGLALCKKFVEMHNGVITVESAPERGSTFTVRLPQGTDFKSVGDQI